MKKRISIGLVALVTLTSQQLIALESKCSKLSVTGIGIPVGAGYPRHRASWTTEEHMDYLAGTTTVNSRSRDVNDWHPTVVENRDLMTGSFPGQRYTFYHIRPGTSYGIPWGQWRITGSASQTAAGQPFNSGE